ncbi:hypothetical protein XM38_003130 [Halomicronema hongdechloris C2206]|uniref:PspA/IM30 family protein n=1 Tax=Halomicronema hongdechloris C2206 TaxID=1641165 RepID=A0A1Z3HGI5_9CYAN|nr:PspA/IM30 family protein [Halomicronema hongdechloris]ASC69386.1 hypothetical protein XM38_003130 [Halomicronema hongdechloris C2206]
MKKFVYWLMGERAGRVVVISWNWLWGRPIEADSQGAVNAAEESLRSMQTSVQQLSQAVSTQAASYERAKKKYEIKVKELQDAEHEAVLAQQLGNIEAARLAMTRALQIERFLPQLEQRVRQVEALVNQSKEKLDRERMRLEAYKFEFQHMKDMAEINEALRLVAETNDSLNIQSSQSQFEAAKAVVEDRSFYEEAYAELSEDPQDQLQADIEKMTLNDQVEKRLKKLRNSELTESPQRTNAMNDKPFIDPESSSQ